MDNVTGIWNEVRDWPPDWRRELVSRLLDSLRGGERPTSRRSAALSDLIGIWKTAAAPNDEQVREIVEHERIRKYG